jgi:erythronate-4-phosphate dehydrogenase
MQIVADESIPLIRDYFGVYGEVVTKPGREIKRADLLTADILLVRAVTTVNEQLLQNTKVRFVGSVTAGADHLDSEWLNQAGIVWNVASGCNAAAVAEYIVSVIAYLQKKDFLPQKKCRAGVIGVGHAGKRVADKLHALNFEVILCDPLRAEQEKNFYSTPIEQLADLDLITLHVPLIRLGPYPTYHFIEKQFLERQKNNCVLINTSRGEVIHSDDFKCYGKHLIWCLDVFENEPVIDREVYQPAVIATPHIAGYSVQSKFRGIEMIYQAACQHKIIHPKSMKEIKYPTQELSLNNTDMDWRDVILKIYDPSSTTQEMKQALMENENVFDELRKKFQKRNEFAYIKIIDENLNERDKLILKCLELAC